MNQGLIQLHGHVSSGLAPLRHQAQGRMSASGSQSAHSEPVTVRCIV